MHATSKIAAEQNAAARAPNGRPGSGALRRMAGATQVLGTLPLPQVAMVSEWSLEGIKVV